MESFEENCRTKETGDEQSKDSASQVERFLDFDYEETMQEFDAVRGVPELDLGATIEDEIKEEFGEELESDHEERMHKDDFFTVLSNNRRRTVLRYMNIRSDEAPFNLGELAEVVAAQENDKERDRITTDERKRVYVALYQSHLPVIDKAGLIDYNSDRGLIDLSEEVDDYAFESMMALLEDEVYPEGQRVDQEYFERVFADDGEESYLSRFRQKLSLSRWGE